MAQSSASALEVAAVKTVAVDTTATGASGRDTEKLSMLQANQENEFSTIDAKIGVATDVKIQRSIVLQNFGKVNMVPAGVGWGTVAAEGDFTTPLCQNSLGSFSTLAESGSGRSATWTTTTFQSDTVLQAAIEKGTASAQLLSQAASSLLAGSSGKIVAGSKLVHIRYWVPVMKQTIRDIATACEESSVVQTLISKGISGNLTDEAIDNFVLTHGTSVVYSVILGGQIDIFQVDKNNVAEASILEQKCSRSTLSTSKIISVFGGKWETSKWNSDETTLRKAADIWMQGLYSDGAHLAILDQKTVPMKSLFRDANFAARVASRIDKLSEWLLENARMPSQVQSAEVELQRVKAKIGASRLKDKVTIMPRALSAGVNFCRHTGEHLDRVVRGYVGHEEDALEKSSKLCQGYFLWFCFEALPDVIRRSTGWKWWDSVGSFLRLMPKMGEIGAVVEAGVKSCYKHRMLPASFVDLAHGFLLPQEHISARSENSSVSLLSFEAAAAAAAGGQRKPTEQLENTAVEDLQDQLEVNFVPSQSQRSRILGSAVGSWIGTPGLGWAMSPVEKSYTEPVCLTDAGHIDGQVAADVSYPVQPRISFYNSSTELSLAISDLTAVVGLSDPFAAGMANILSFAKAHDDRQKSFLHISYVVPVKSAVIRDPAIACMQRALTKLCAMKDPSDHDIDSFLSRFGSRINYASVLGGRIDMISVHDRSNVNLDFLVSVDRKHSRNDFYINVEGGKWDCYQSNYSGETPKALVECLQLWVEDVYHDDSVKAVLKYRSLPISSLVPENIAERLQTRMQNFAMNAMQAVGDSARISYQIQSIKKHQAAFNAKMWGWFSGRKTVDLLNIIDALSDLRIYTRSFARVFNEGHSGVLGALRSLQKATSLCSLTWTWVCENVLQAKRRWRKSEHVRERLSATGDACAAHSFDWCELG
eukprot:TRINITY_DN8534_c0_g1_i1.p1 TRINITY_DN8534_c0_g1~~TRINITY_DN8534_c0_g1_i1.p1  ORF type:complete len:1003 (+),score=152.90 TRINITY_DN8534_c0_g1_i1:214-3009(+)